MKKTKERVATTTFDEEHLLLLSERKAQGLSGDVSEEDVVWYAEQRYRNGERKRVVDGLHKDIVKLIRKNEGVFGESAIADFQDMLRKCQDDIERARVCSQWRRMYEKVKGE